MAASAFPSLRGRRVLVTGSTGFKGAWLCQWLLELGAEVSGLALAPDGPNNLFERLGLARHIDQNLADIRELANVERALSSSRAELVLHLAAQSLVRPSYRDPHGTFTTNVLGGLNVLEAVRRNPNVGALVYVATDKVYRNREWVWGYRETDALGGHDPYSASKAAAELVLDGYARSYFATRSGFGWASARAGNVIGGGDWAEDRIVPDVMRALELNQPIVVRNPTAVRPWQHVLEPLSGYLQLATALFEEPTRVSGDWNFGPADASTRTVRELAERLIALMGAGRIELGNEQNAPHETTLLQLSVDKARRSLGWQPVLDFERAVTLTGQWYRSVRDGGDPREITVAQLREYTQLRAEQRP